jgi:hypothetical protein
MSFNAEVTSGTATESGRHMSDKLYIGDRLRKRNMARVAHRAAVRNTNTLSRLEERSGGPINRLRQRRRLRTWLERKKLLSPEHANEEFKYQRESSRQNEEFASLDETELSYIRTAFGKYTDFSRKRGDALLRKYNFPAELIDACDAQSGPDGTTNVITWLSTEPTDDSPYGATDEQLEAALLWNADHTETLAANPEEFTAMVESYLGDIQKAVDDGRLDPVWATIAPSVDRIVVGDIFDEEIMGVNGYLRGGVYYENDRELAVWPYEEDEEDGSTRHSVAHETTHAMGGFKTRWVNEAYTERFSCIIEGTDPDETDDNLTYIKGREAIANLYKLAPKPIGDLEVSACFAGDDREQNEQALIALFQDAYNGHDIIGLLNEAESKMLDDFRKAASPEWQIKADACVHETADLITYAVNMVSTHPSSIPRLIDMFEKQLASMRNVGNSTGEDVTAYVVAHETVIGYLEKLSEPAATLADAA